MKKLLLAITAMASMYASAADPTLTPKDGYPDFALGADVSWTRYIEDNHLHTYYRGYQVATDQTTSIPQMVSDHGIDAIRLRVWVDPNNEVALAGFSFTAGGYKYTEMSTYGTCGIDDMVEMAHRFAKQGQRIMVTFQMSDTWADPGRQFIPASWRGCTTVQQLSDHVVAHVTDVLTRLHDRNVNVAWVQIGNETNTGMLKWELPTTATGNHTMSTLAYGCEIASTGNTTKNFVKVFTDASRAAKAVYPDTKVVLHLANSSEWSKVNWTMNLLNRAGLSTDVCDYIGLSLYPGLDDGQDSYTAKWQTYADRSITTISNLYKNYGYRTLLCEIGMNNEYSLSANTSGVSAAGMQECYIKQCNTDVRAFTQYLIDKLDTAESTCDGFFYWEPETDYMKGYTKGACVSVTPGASWPRDKVTANDWWTVVSENSTFPAGGLVEYRVSDNTTPDFVPDPSLQLYLSYYDNEEIRVPLATTDGLLYTLTGFAAPQWFNFKIINADWTIALGNAEIGLNQEAVLNNRNDWNAWTSTTVSPTDTWWLRWDTRAMTITANAQCPWPGLNGVATAIVYSDTPAYYNLQGIKLTAPPAAGPYIERSGTTVTKRIAHP